jgi:hypothetical protein
VEPQARAGLRMQRTRGRGRGMRVGVGVEGRVIYEQHLCTRNKRSSNLRGGQAEPFCHLSRLWLQDKGAADPARRWRPRRKGTGHHRCVLSQRATSSPQLGAPGTTTWHQGFVDPDNFLKINNKLLFIMKLTPTA